MKKTVKVFAAASIAVLLGSLFASCSSGLSIIEETAYENTRSVIVNDQIAVTSAIAKPFGLVADTSTDNIIRLAWGSPSVPVDSWNIYLDGNKVDNTSILKQIEIKSYSGEHVVAVAALKNGKRSEAEGITVTVKGTAAPSSSDPYTLNSSISAPFGLVADTAESNAIGVAWGAPSVMPEAWAIYLDGKYVTTTKTFGRVSVAVSTSGNHEVGIAAVNGNSRSEIATVSASVTVSGNTQKPDTPTVTLPSVNGITSGETYTIMAKCSGKALDVADVSKEPGHNVHQWDYVGGENQKWVIKQCEDGNWTITSVHSNLCLDADNWGKSEGTNIIQYYNNEQANQKFAIEEIESGYYKLTNVNSGLVLDVSNSSKENGANVQLWSWNGSDAQKWAIAKVVVNESKPVETPVDTPVYNPGLTGKLAVTESEAAAAYSSLQAPKDNGYVSFTFENVTNGKFKNNEIFIVVLYQRNDGIYYWGRPDGTFKAVGANEYCDNYSYTIEDNNGTNGRRVFNIPKNTNGARIFYSYGSKMNIHGPENGVGVVFPSIANPGDPDYNKYYDWLEYTIRDDGVTWVNTTQVDQFGFPALITAYSSNGSVRSNGDGLFTQTGVTASRDEVYTAYKQYMASKGVSADFDCLAEQYRIVCPGKSSKFNKHYLDSYINEIWNYWTTHSTEVKHAQGKFILSGDGQNLKFYCTESYNPAMCRAGETYYVYGKPSTEHAFEGAGCLATDTKGNGMEPALQAWVCAAINRGVATRSDAPAWSYTSAPAPTNYKDSYYQGGKCNYYSGFWHSISTNNGLAYGFCYDDVHEQSSTTVVIDCQKIWVRLGF
ncbi:MAG: beta-1,3-glucanase family protein [Treponema sp.]|nr:beta-1,3-glucanase family protein [Treponema sp.]